MTSGKKIHSCPANSKGVYALDIMKIMEGGGQRGTDKPGGFFLIQIWMTKVGFLVQ